MVVSPFGVVGGAVRFDRAALTGTFEFAAELFGKAEVPVGPCGGAYAGRGYLGGSFLRVFGKQGSTRHGMSVLWSESTQCARPARMTGRVLRACPGRL